MRHRAWIALAPIIVAACGGSAGEATEAEAAPSATAPQTAGGEGDEGMPIASFVASIAPIGAAGMCVDGEAIRQCAPSLSEAECQNLFVTAVHACAEALAEHLPSVVYAQDAEAVAAPLGECDARAYLLGVAQAGVEVIPECQGEL